MITVDLVGDRALVAKLNAMPEKVRRALERKVAVLAIRMERRVKQKLSGEVLQKRTGNLRDSITQRVESTPDSVSAHVFSRGDVKYAAIHEYGGQTAAHVIRARRGKALAFTAGGQDVFARQVNHPGSRIPARPYMRPTLAEFRKQILDGLNDAVREGLK